MRFFDHSDRPMPALFQKWMSAAAAEGTRVRVLYPRPATPEELARLRAERQRLERRRGFRRIA